MAEVINLNRARKARARTEKAGKAVENRVRFGRSKADRAADKARTELAERRLEGHRKDGEAPEDG